MFGLIVSSGRLADEFESLHSQTPDFNAKPIVEAVLDAARRGVECVLYICVGYNDAVRSCRLFRDSERPRLIGLFVG